MGWEQNRSETDWEIIDIRRAAAAKRRAARKEDHQRAYDVCRDFGMDHKAALKYANAYAAERHGPYGQRRTPAV